MSKYNEHSEILEIKQRLCELISYIIWLEENKHITQRTKEELLKRINPDVFEGSVKLWHH